MLRARALADGLAALAIGGMSTVSTSWPSCSRSSSFRVPSDVVSELTTSATPESGAYAEAMAARARAPRPERAASSVVSEEAGSRPVRRWRQRQRAPSSP